MPTAIDLTGSQKEIRAILALARERGEVEEVSEPTALDASRALNVGLPHVNPTEALEFISLVFTTGTTALAFFKNLRAFLKDRSATVAASQTVSGQALGRIEAGTSDEDLEKIAAS
jgi:hypothetical protein